MSVNNTFWVGVVEDRNDPEALGRCKVRIVGLHTHDTSLLPTSDLPWALPITPVTSAAMNGIGVSPIGPVEGTTVMMMFADHWKQQPIMFGTVGGKAGIPLSQEDISIDTRSRPIAARDIELNTVQNIPSGSTTITVDSNSDLTDTLRPNMQIFGAGIPDGTLVTAITGNTITLSQPTTGELNGDFLNFGEPPTNLDALAESRAGDFVTDSSGNPVTTSSGNPIRSEPTAITPDDNSANRQIPTVPPPNSTSDTGKASFGINALLQACDEVGLTTKEQKCALLGICGGESRWIPQQESYNYSLTRIQQVYRFASASDAERYSRAPSKGMSREEFFSWAYGPTQRGANFIGNQTNEDGGRFYGRGFIQLTGRGNYERYQRLGEEMGLNIDIVNNPDTLNTDIRVSALVAALYLKDRVSRDVSPSANPDYFFAAKRAVGNNTPDIAQIKRDYYEYFYGAAAAGTVARSAGTPYSPPSTEPWNGRPQSSQAQASRGAQNLGFRDPNSKYPIEEMQSENHTNRNARGERIGTNFTNKESTRHTDIPRPLGLGGWSQPPTTYGPKYPFNHVRETESGHIQEFDDTPGYERISTYHRAGTYTDIDPNGTQINYIVGDNFTIVENNGNVHIAGQCNITVDGDTNIFARSNANIEVSADANIQVGNNVNMGVTNDVNWVVGGNMTMKVEKDFVIDSNNLTINTDLATNVRTTTLNAQALGDVNIKGDANMFLETGANLDIYGGAETKLKSVGALHLKGVTANIESEGTLDMLSGGKMSVDYSSGAFGEGAGSATDALPNQAKVARPSQGEFSTFADTTDAGEPIDEDVNENVWGTGEVDEAGNETQPFVPLFAPQLVEPLNANRDQLDPPPASFEEENETPEDWSTPQGRQESARLRRETGDPNADALATVEETVAAPSNNAEVREVDTSVVENTSRFTDDFRMSQNFNFGMCYDPSGGHTLRDQVGLTKQQIVANLCTVLENVIEPLIAQNILPQGMGGYGNLWKVNSGYRESNSRSQHNRGQAFDLGLIKSPLAEKANATYELVQEIARSGVPFDQLILEYRHPQSVWIHISCKAEGNRGQAFTMVNDRTHSQGFTLITRIPPKNR